VAASRFAAITLQDGYSVLQALGQAVVVSDLDGVVVFWNAAAERIFGWTSDEAVGRRAVEMTVSKLHREQATGIMSSLRSGQSWSGRFTVSRRDGTTFPALMTDSGIYDAAGELTGIVGTFTDLSGQLAAEARLHRSEALHRAIVETSGEGILLVGSDGVITFANHQLAEFLGLAVSDLVGRSSTSFLPNDLEVLARLDRRRQGIGERYEFPFGHPDGSTRHLLVSVKPLYDDDGMHLGSLSTFADITERKRAEAALTRLAMRDPLTGLANRTMLMERLDAALAKKDASAGRVALLFVDLDQFKSVNDSLGHGVGDELLLLATERISKAVRAQDTVARLGGDEFVVLAEGLKSGEQANRLAQRICATFRQPMHVAGLDLVITASIGVAVTDRPGVCAAHVPGDEDAMRRAASELLRQADIAVYQAKAKGRACWERYEPETSDRADQLRLVGELRSAVTKRELRLHFQPIMDLATGRMVAAEALLRWQHPSRGLLAPDDFIPLAEQTGLIRELDGWALEAACRQAAAWHRADPDRAPLGIAVNLSARQLADRHLPSRLDTILRQTGLDPASLVIEITETALMDDPDAALGVLHALKGLGIRLSIDDFGTGYSSLVYLKRFPVDELKIDRSFVDGLGVEAEDTAIVSSVLSLAKAVGVKVVAEGVETEDQRRILVELGCEFGQGYLWSRPLPELLDPQTSLAV